MQTLPVSLNGNSLYSSTNDIYEQLPGENHHMYDLTYEDTTSTRKNRAIHTASSSFKRLTTTFTSAGSYGQRRYRKWIRHGLNTLFGLWIVANNLERLSPIDKFRWLVLFCTCTFEIINYSLIQTNRYLPKQSCDCTIKGCIVPAVFYLDLVPARGPSPFEPKKILGKMNVYDVNN